MVFSFTSCKPFLDADTIEFQPIQVVSHTIGLYTVSHGKFHDRGYSDILDGIKSIGIMGCCTPEHSVTTITW